MRGRSEEPAQRKIKMGSSFKEYYLGKVKQERNRSQLTSEVP